MICQPSSPEDRPGHSETKPWLAGVEVQIQPSIPGNGGCRDGRPVRNPLHDIEPGVLILGLVHIRIIDQMRSALSWSLAILRAPEDQTWIQKAGSEAM
jgi:hypothetical protein